ncbi:MAG: hypothetical protein ACYCQI_10010 [Gammaproteobacteria bacterium]
MAHPRSEAKIENGEYKTESVLLRTVTMPNGNLLCVHKEGPGGRRARCYLSIFDPRTKMTLTKRMPLDTVRYDMLAKYHSIYFLSDDSFLFHNKHDIIYLYKIIKDTIHCIRGSQNEFTKIHFVDNNLIIGEDFDDDESVSTIDANTLTVLQTTLHADDLIWSMLPSGKMYKFHYRASTETSKIMIFDHHHDSVPSKEIICHINKKDFCKMLSEIYPSDDDLDLDLDEIEQGGWSRFGKFTMPLSENVIVLESNGIYVCLDLQTGRTCLLPEFLAFCNLPNNRTLISLGQTMMILDHHTMELTPVSLGLDLKEYQTCTSISLSNGKIIFTLSNSDTLYITDLSLLDAKQQAVVDVVMNTITRMPEPLAKIIQSYRGYSLFDRDVKSELEQQSQIQASDFRPL